MAYRTVLKPNFKFELAVSAILQYGYRRANFKICFNLILNFTILNMVTGALVLT